jgi:hypothetical protein
MSLIVQREGTKLPEIFDLIIRVFVSTKLSKKQIRIKRREKFPAISYHRVVGIRHDNSTKENFIFKFYIIFLMHTYCYKALVNVVENNKNFTVDQK